MSKYTRTHVRTYTYLIKCNVGAVTQPSISVSLSYNMYLFYIARTMMASLLNY